MMVTSFVNVLDSFGRLGCVVVSCWSENPSVVSCVGAMLSSVAALRD